MSEIVFVKNKKETLNLLKSNSMVHALMKAHRGTQEEYSKIYNCLSFLVGEQFREHKGFEIIKLKEKINFLEEVLGDSPVLTKNVGSANFKTYIWHILVENRNYLIFYSKEGMSISTDKENEVSEIAEDLSKIVELTEGV